VSGTRRIYFSVDPTLRETGIAEWLFDPGHVDCHSQSPKSVHSVRLERESNEESEDSIEVGINQCQRNLIA